MFEPGHVILYTRYTMDSAHTSIIPEFVQKIELLGLQDFFYVTKTSIVNKSTNSEIIFKGLKTSSGEQSAKLKSLNGITTWVLEEAEELTDEDIFDKIDFSVRVKGKQNRVILLLNPTTKEHFIYDKFFVRNGVQPSTCTSKDGVTYIHTTYLDNLKYLAPDYIANAERMKIENPVKYEWVFMGGWLPKAEGVIFDNIKIGEFIETDSVYYGSDFGFSNDPSTCIKVSLDLKRKIMWLKEIFYAPRLDTKDFISLYKNNTDGLIIADSAEPRLIQEIANSGIRIVGAEKGPGSILEGIRMMLDYEIIVDPDSVNLIKEFNNYSWSKGTGKTIPKPGFDHCIDAVRYVVLKYGKKTTPITKRFY